MILAAILLHVLAAPELFDVATVPVRNEGDPVFFAPVDGNQIADLVVQSGRELHIRLDDGTQHDFTLPEGVSAYDIHDIDGDERPEVIAIRHREVLAIAPMLNLDEQPSERLLFKADSLYAMGTSAPCRQVLIKTFQKQTALLLPEAGTLVAYALGGSVLGKFPNLPDAPRYMPDFISEPWNSASEASPGSNWTYINQESELIPDLPPELRPPDVPFAITLAKSSHPNSTLETVAGFEFKAGKYAGTWDSVIISRGTGEIRLAMLRNDDNGNTLVFLREVPLTADGEDWTNTKDGPIRRYPGRLVSERWWTASSVLSQRPDFNGDGFMDLLLCDVPQPGMSVDSIMRTVVGRTWPVRFTIQLYAPDKQRFEPKPAYALTLKVPIGWLLEHGPIRNLSLSDFDGDGRTDIALSTDENEYQVWLAANGFTRDPDWTHTFPEPVEDIQLTADLRGNGRTSILLRGEKNLYLLQARP